MASRREPEGEGVETVTLAGQPASVSAARRHVRSLLADEDVTGPVVDDIALVVTELVANWVLHAGGPVSLRLSFTGRSAAGVAGRGVGRLAVAAGRAQLRQRCIDGTGPRPRRPDRRRVGVDRIEGGKTVWAELVLDGSEDDDVATPVSTMPAGEPVALAAGSVVVHYLGVPVAPYLQLQEQNDAILRELELLAFTADLEGEADPSPELVDVIERSAAPLRHRPGRVPAAVVGAAEAGRTSIDLEGSGAPAGSPGGVRSSPCSRTSSGWLSRASSW